MHQAFALAALIFLAATLYGSVGHAGASGYLAAMALVGLEPGVMKPTALMLNILAASIVTLRFYRAGCFSWQTFWPFAAGSIPMAFIGGAMHLPGGVYKPIVGVVLLIAALRLAHSAGKPAAHKPAHQPTLAAALLCGGGIGLLSGLTGTGGGIFLSPLLLFMGWAETREAAGVSAAFILANSVAGLAGNLMSVRSLTPWVLFWAVAAALGAALGSELGARHLAPRVLRYLLAAVLVVAGCKLMFVG